MKSSHLYKYYSDFIIQYDFINVFQYKKLGKKGLPKLQKLVLSFSQTYSTNFFSICTFSQLLTKTVCNMRVQTSFLNPLKGKTKQKSISSVYELKKNMLFLFFSMISKDIFSMKHLRIMISSKDLPFNNIFSYNFNKLVLFDLMKNNYSLFKELETFTNLSLNILFYSKKKEELLFLLCSYNLVQFR
jgi:hypothetical protein